MKLSPLDSHNQKLLENTHPADWKNPSFDGIYDLVIIGAGTAGLVTAAGAAGVGAKVALIERALMGGDCLNYGCVPSKALISAAKLISNAKKASIYGVSSDFSTFDFKKVMEHVRSVRAHISSHDSAERFSSLGVDVYLGQATFNSETSVALTHNSGDQELRFHRAVIATGARAATPNIAGLADVDFHTNETIFNITELPRKLCVIGAGPIGCELSQSFRRLGSEVTIVDVNERIMHREEVDASEIVQAKFIQEGITLKLSERIKSMHQEGESKIVTFSDGSTESFDTIMSSIGRAPNVDGLGLETVGVEYDERAGVKINDLFQTSNPRIFAAGDIAMKAKFTHAADFAARAVIQNALFFGAKIKGKKLSSLNIPWCTYTDPEIAHTGMYEEEAKAAGHEVEVFRKDFSGNDRALAEAETEGYVKIISEKGQILGATVVGEHAGDLISEISVAMQAGMGLGSLASVIHPYPTRAEVIRQTGDLYNKTKLTPTTSKLLKGAISISRAVS